MTNMCKLTVDAVLKMAVGTAQKYAHGASIDSKANEDLMTAIAATWKLVKSRLGNAESAELDALVAKLVGGTGEKAAETFRS